MLELCNKGADVHAQGGKFGNPLQAVVCGRIPGTILELILMRGVNTVVTHFKLQHVGAALEVCGSFRIGERVFIRRVDALVMHCKLQPLVAISKLFSFF